MSRVHRPGLALAVAAASLPLVLGACGKPTDDPRKAFQLFVERVQVGDADAAWDLLSKETQEQLADFVKRRSAGSGGAIPDDPKAVIFGNATLAKPIEKVEVKEEGDARAVLVVTHPGGDSSQEVTMVREAGGWRLSIDLPPAS